MMYSMISDSCAAMKMNLGCVISGNIRQSLNKLDLVYLFQNFIRHIIDKATNIKTS